MATALTWNGENCTYLRQVFFHDVAYQKNEIGQRFRSYSKKVLKIAHFLRHDVRECMAHAWGNCSVVYTPAVSHSVDVRPVRCNEWSRWCRSRQRTRGRLSSYSCTERDQAIVVHLKPSIKQRNWTELETQCTVSPHFICTPIKTWFGVMSSHSVTRNARAD